MCSSLGIVSSDLTFTIFRKSENSIDFDIPTEYAPEFDAVSAAYYRPDERFRTNTFDVRQVARLFRHGRRELAEFNG